MSLNSKIASDHASHPPATHNFRLSKLSVVIASATFLSACAVVQNPSGETYPSSDDVVADPARTISNRESPARVRIEPGFGGSTLESAEYDDIWSRIADGLSFSLEPNNERIEKQIAFYKENPNFIKTVTERASPFIFTIVEELERRNMPLELALLPIVESAYNPNATAGQNSAGLWQIIGSTAKSLGLKQDWWYDGRRDPIASTAAALDYLTTLNEMFDHDWPLTLAAYNSGQGNIQKAIEQNQRKSRPTDYWSLNLSSVTEEFVPKLIALSRLLSSPEDYGLELAEISNEPVLAQVDVGSQIDLALAASIAGLEPETLYQLNPGFRQWATHPDGPHTLLLPINEVEAFTSALAATLQAQSPVTWDRYVVQKGDSLSKIAKQFRTQVSALQQANGIDGSRIIAGESLLIPRAYNSATPLITPNAPEYLPGVAYSADITPEPVSPPARYEVRSGDNLWRIATRYNLTTEALASRNNISADSVLRPGQVLIVQSDPAIAQAGRDASEVEPVYYNVKSGDTLARIARRFGVGVTELADWNGIREENVIHPGQQLVLHPAESKLN